MTKVDLVKENDGWNIYPFCIDCEHNNVNEKGESNCSSSSTNGRCDTHFSVEIIGNLAEVDMDWHKKIEKELNKPFL